MPFGFDLQGASPKDNPDLKPDCERCCGLCCVVPAFSASADFAIDKRPGKPCPHLTERFRCGIHDRLRAEGFRGCAAYDCFGAGQKVTQITFKGRDWRTSPHIAGRMFEVFTVMQHLHAMLRYLSEALRLEAAQPLHGRLQLKFEEVEGCSFKDPDALLEIDVEAHKAEVNDLLLRVSELVRFG